MKLCCNTVSEMRFEPMPPQVTSRPRNHYTIHIYTIGHFCQKEFSPTS